MSGVWAPCPYNNDQRTERKRLRSLIHDYCFTEQCGKGCVDCPVEKAKACGDMDVPMSKLREAEKIIQEERRKR